MADNVKNPPSRFSLAWPWPKNIRDQITLRTQFQQPAQRRAGDPKDPPLASWSVFEFLKTEGGVTGTRLSIPPTVYQLWQESAQRAMRRALMRRALARATKSKGVLAQLVGPGELALLTEDRRASVKEELEREESMLKLLDALRSELDEIAKKQADEAAQVPEREADV